MRRLGDAPTPPADDAPGWESVKLPDYWGIAIRRQHLEGWYRGTVHLADAPRELWAVFLPRIGQNVAVWVNHELVGDGGPFTEPLPRNWNRPQLYSVPSRLLHAGDNVVHVRIRTHPGAPGYLRAIYVGPARELGPVFELRSGCRSISRRSSMLPPPPPGCSCSSSRSDGASCRRRRGSRAASSCGPGAAPTRSCIASRCRPVCGSDRALSRRANSAARPRSRSHRGHRDRVESENLCRGGFSAAARARRRAGAGWRSRR
jgi:hypothetical protein